MAPYTHLRIQGLKRLTMIIEPFLSQCLGPGEIDDTLFLQRSLYKSPLLVQGASELAKTQTI